MNNILFHMNLAAVLLSACGVARISAQTTYEQRHEDYYDDISGRKINLGQTDGPHRAGRTGFWTTQGRLHRGMATSNPGKVWGELKTTLLNADGAEDAGGANGGFSGWPGMDTYMRWHGARIAFPGYTTSETLTNFPMFVRLDAANVPRLSYAQMAFGNAADLCCTDFFQVRASTP